MENNLHEPEDNKFIPMTSFSSGSGKEVKKDVYYYTNQIVNVIMIGEPGQADWVLIDAGMPKSGPEIMKVAAERFGPENKPAAIILTHGHFDHIGGIVALTEAWNVPVYAHILEFPFLTGERDYPEPDPTVEGGLLAKIASFYPNERANISPVLQPLPEDHTLPFLPGWRWVHTPGHSPGQVALFRDSDRILISADAFITVKQDSFYKVLVQKEEVEGPPRYFTTNWQEAWNSVKELERLQPELVVPGHGQFMEGEALKLGLKNLVEHFNEIAIPDYGKFVNEKDKAGKEGS